MLRALEKNSYDEVLRVLKDDETASFDPITDSARCEPPLVCAVHRGCSPKIWALLVEHGAHVDGTGYAGMTPLEALCCRKRQQLLVPIYSQLQRWQAYVQPEPGDSYEYELKCDAELPVGSCGIPEDSSIHRARCLLQLGADPCHTDASGLTASDHAVKSGQPELAHFLQHWHGWQLCSQLHIMWGRCKDSNSRPDLQHMPPTVQRLICTMLAPDRARTAAK